MENDMGVRPPTLGNFEELILLAILKLGNEAYGVPIRHELEDAMEKEISVGALYTTLERLEQKGYVNSWQGMPTAARGGRAKRYYKVKSAGMAALQETQRVRSRILKELESFGGLA
jgi:PadR family transcriptional regulator, regulatory protein PadR